MISTFFKSIIHTILEWHPYLYHWYKKVLFGVTNKPNYSD